MQLLVNTFITDRRLNPCNRGILSIPDRLDVLRYTLESFAVLPISKAYLYLEMDHNYGDRDLSFVYDLFPEVELYNQRIKKQKAWQAWVDRLNNEHVWYLCNDDHVFLDRELTVLNDILAAMTEDNCSLYFSHFPELIAEASEAQTTLFPNYLKYWGGKTDSVQVMSKKLLHTIWHIADYGETELPRTDWVSCSVPSGGHWIYVPLRELCRHFDGYGGHMLEPLKVCPPLAIPPGFFDRAIKIRYGYEDNKEGWVNINPLKQTYTAVDPQGTDYKWLLKDIPLFWKSRIVEIDANPIDEALALQQRNEAFLAILTGRCLPQDRIPYAWQQAALACFQ